MLTASQEFKIARSTMRAAFRRYGIPRESIPTHILTKLSIELAKDDEVSIIKAQRLIYRFYSDREFNRRVFTTASRSWK